MDDDKILSITSDFVPVFVKKVRKILVCISTATAVIITTHNVSISLSVTTVPSDFANDTLSYFANTPHREISPTRGITRLAAYEMKIELTQLEVLGYSLRGAKVSFHLIPRKT